MNQDIKEKIKAAGLTQRQVARQMGIFEHALQRMLMKNLSGEKRNEIMMAIDVLSEGGKHE